MNWKEEYRLENRSWALNKCWAGADLLNSGTGAGTFLRQPAVHGVIDICVLSNTFACHSVLSVFLLVDIHVGLLLVHIIDTYVGQGI